MNNEPFDVNEFNSWAASNGLTPGTVACLVDYLSQTISTSTLQEVCNDYGIAVGPVQSCLYYWMNRTKLGSRLTQPQGEQNQIPDPLFQTELVTKQVDEAVYTDDEVMSMIDPVSIVRTKQDISFHVRSILQLLEGTEDLRSGIVDTPDRVARMLLEITAGERHPADQEILVKSFRDDTTSDCQGMIVSDNIPFRSTCCHHLCAFTGVVHFGYIPEPGGSIVGLSKVPRLVQKYALRLQLQERMTIQLLNAFCSVAKPLGAIVVVQAEHTCLTQRGVLAHGAGTSTVELRGVFNEAAVRSEFYSILQLRRK